MNYVKKLNLHWFCTQNHILEPFSVRRAYIFCTKSYLTSEPYPRVSQIWCQNVRETWKKKVTKCRGESFARCRVIARNVEGGGFLGPPPPVFLGLRVPEALLFSGCLSVCPSGNLVNTKSQEPLGGFLSYLARGAPWRVDELIRFWARSAQGQRSMNLV